MLQVHPSSLARPASRPKVRRLLAAGAMLASSAVAAADFSVGVGAGIDRGKVDCLAAFPCDHSSAHAKIYGAYQLSEAVDLQFVYFDAGRFKGADTSPLGTEFGGDFKVSGFGVTAGYRWPLASAWSLTARAGVASLRTRFDYTNPVWGTASKTTTQPLAGIGLSYAFTPAWRLGLDYDVTRFKAHTRHGSLQMLGVATQFSF